MVRMTAVAIAIAVWFLLSQDRVAAPARSAAAAAIRSGAGRGAALARSEWEADAPYRANRLHDRQAWLHDPDRGNVRKYGLAPAHKAWRWALRWGSRLDDIGLPALGTGIAAAGTAGANRWRERRDQLAQQRADHGTLPRLIGDTIRARTGHPVADVWHGIRSWRTRIRGGCVWLVGGDLRSRSCGKPVDPRAKTLCTEHARELDADFPDLPLIISDPARDPHPPLTPVSASAHLFGTARHPDGGPNAVPAGWPEVPAPPIGLVATEDQAEEAGALDPADRRTCSTCRTYATDEHTNSVAHKRAIGIPEDWQFDPKEGRFRPPGREHPSKTTPAIPAGDTPSTTDRTESNVVPLTLNRSQPGPNTQLDIVNLQHLVTVLDGISKQLADVAPQLKAAAETSQGLPDALAFNPGTKVRALLSDLADHTPDPAKLTAWMETAHAAAAAAREVDQQMETVRTTGVEGHTSQVASTGS